MRMINPKFLDPYSKEFKQLCAAAGTDLRAAGAMREERDAEGTLHKGVLSGSEMVQWMLSQGHCETRLHATQICNVMVKAGFLSTVIGGPVFCPDAKSFYRIREAPNNVLRKVSSRIFGRNATAPSRSPAGIVEGALTSGIEYEWDEEHTPADIPPIRSSSLRRSRSYRSQSSSGGRSSIEMVCAFIPGHQERTSRRQLKMNTQRNRSKVSRETQLRVLVTSESTDLSEGSSFDPQDQEEEDMSFPEVGFERGRSKIKFSDTIHVREINDTKPREYERFMDPGEEEPIAVQLYQNAEPEFRLARKESADLV